MKDWEPGDLRALAAYVLADQGRGVGTDAEFGEYVFDLAEALAVRTVRTEAESSYPDHQPLTNEQVHQVRRYIEDAELVIDGEHFGAGL